MVQNFRERLITKIVQKKSLVCIGLDPDLNAKQFPAFLKDEKKPKLEFAKALIDEVKDLVPIIKPNTRFYSMHPDDYEGDQLAGIVKYAHKHDLEVIADCKENDIMSTMARAYENQFKFGFDALTVNGYFGSDGIEGDGIFDKWFEQGKGLFVLVKTSNPSSNELQDVVIDELRMVSGSINVGYKVYHLMSELVEKWSVNYAHVIGAVVGATDLEVPREGKIIKAGTMLHEIATLMDGIILIPGYGSQGGKADVLDDLPDGKFCIVNSSRGIMYAYDRRFKGKFTQDEFAKAAREEVKFMRDDLNKHFKPFKE